MLARLGIPDFSALEGDRLRRAAARFEERDLGAFLIRMFVLGAPIDAADLGAAMEPAEHAAFVSTGLLDAIEPGEPTDAARRWYSPIRLAPLTHRDNDLLIACDRLERPDGSAFEPPPDIVFSGHNPLTRQFLGLLPATDTGTMLDLCSGTGVGALAAAPTARRVTAVDITERCTAFARFNCWLNGIDHVDVRCGDLFAPVRDERFDRIVAHPPYVPTLADIAIYRDGGETGDRLLRQIVAALPDHLTPGGTFHMLTIGMDTAGAPFEMRVREWLGAAGAEFDVVFALADSKSPAEFARSLVGRVAGSKERDHDRWSHLFDEMQLREVVYGALVGRRIVTAAGDPQTRRVIAEAGVGPDGFEWLFRWFDWLRLPDRRERVLSLQPRLAPDATVAVAHVVRDGHFAPDRFRLRNGGVPFTVQLQSDGWVVAMMDGFDGTRTVAEMYGVARMAGSIPEQMSEGEFVDLICLLVEKGLLRAPDAPQGG